MARKDIFGSVMGPATASGGIMMSSGYAIRGASRSIMQSFEELSKSSVVELDPASWSTSPLSLIAWTRTMRRFRSCCRSDPRQRSGLPDPGQTAS